MKIIDSSCLICLLVEINFPESFDLWKKEGYAVCIPMEVYNEISKSQTKSKLEKSIKENKIIVLAKIKEEDLAKFQNRHPNLGRGEIAVIIHAIEAKNKEERYYAVLDDKNARNTAQRNQLKFTGAYGLIKALNTKGAISLEEFSDKVRKMKKSSFRIDIEGI